MIRIPYKCQCMQDEGFLEMEPRRVTEDVIDFMERMQVELGKDHRRRNPLCQAPTVEYVKLEVPEGRSLGEAK